MKVIPALAEGERREEVNDRMSAMALFDLGERRWENLGRIWIWAEQNRREIKERESRERDEKKDNARLWWVGSAQQNT